MTDFTFEDFKLAMSESHPLHKKLTLGDVLPKANFKTLDRTKYEIAGKFAWLKKGKN